MATEVLASDFCLRGLLPHLRGADVCNFAQVCKATADAVRHDWVWELLACADWPANCLDVKRYGSFKALVLDDNRKGAVYVAPLPPARCVWRYSNPWRYFECKVLAVELDRRSNQLRLAFESRGEHDLRHPLHAFLGVASLQEQRAGGGAAPGPLRAHWMLAGTPPSERSIQYATYLQGHFKGTLQWNKRAVAEMEDATSQRTSSAVHALVFTYGLHHEELCVGRMAQVEAGHDYPFVELLRLPPGQSLLTALRAAARFEPRGALLSTLCAEGEDAQQLRWSDLPAQVAAREDWG